MKLNLKTLLAAALFAFCALPAIPAYADVKIAVVDMARVFNESKVGKDAQSRLKAQQDAAVNDLKKEEQSLQTTGMEMQKEQASGKTGPDFDTKKAEFQKRINAFQMKRQTKAQDLQKAQEDALVKLRQQTGDVIKTIAQQDKIDFVLNREAVLLGDQNNDITDRVIAGIDGAAPKAASSATSK